MNFIVCLLQNWNGWPQGTVGLVKGKTDTTFHVLFLSGQTSYEVPKSQVKKVDVSTLQSQKNPSGTHKICSTCHRYLPMERYQTNQRNKGTRRICRPECRDCRKKTDGKRISRKDRLIWEKEKPPEGEFAKCPICGREYLVGVTGFFVLDHNHETGEVRGYICNNCNSGMGKLQDNPSLLQMAADWIKKGGGG